MHLIPKELQNQKAIPFMEWYICYYSNYGGTMDVITDFYSQPFTPEMLEYFEGINDEREDGFYIRLADKYFKIKDSDLFFNNKRATLNSAIEICTLAGVNLTWKGETE